MFFYDGLNPDDVETLALKGIISGLTTNLTLVSAARKLHNKSSESVRTDFVESIKRFKLRLSLQVESNRVDKMILEGKQLQESYGDKVDLYVKIPVNFNNLNVINSLTNSGIKVNATCVTSFLQGKMSALSGAKVISFFWGKMYDQGIDPFRQVNQFKNWVEENSLGQRLTILVGSVRQIGSIEAAFLAGTDVVTTSKENLEKIANQLASDQANQAFQNSL